MKVALSVAGSDSGAGAGIQADLKTFSALGVYGCTAITAITAQNTKKVAEILAIAPEMVKAQIASVMADSPPDAVKVGMVYSNDIIDAVAGSLRGRMPVVLDPILVAGTGAKLLRDDALERFISRLMPRCSLLTPNRMEAEKLSGVRIKGEAGAIEAAERLRSLGAKNVIVKGGHFGKATVTDFLLDGKGRLTKIANPRIDIEESHGSGCNFSSAATAYLARGIPLEEACRMANEYVHVAIKNAVRVGKGLPVTNPLSSIYRDAMRYGTITELQQALDRLATIKDFYRLIPETQTNLVYALPDAESYKDVAGVRGRIVRAGEAAVPVSRAEFGASRHMASAILAYKSARPAYRSVINIRLDPQVLEICRSLFQVSSYDRSKEPMGIKEKEGSTIAWGTKSALARKPEADVIYHQGDVSKEPMITLFGKSPGDVLDRVEKILKRS
ncbi:MAG: bifunctional hydroxymethylpyrimidine kinase/phosphomethylpyrimidine kinase [Nitrososphaera sp.]|uniref:bifunctional hydroxymethylpyrimidine kinase/phosphomethylpyrimidine kinase n=1 Tax=Nitrososphaera sp. TaxID=1971748 RepID=UPI003D6FF891